VCVVGNSVVIRRHILCVIVCVVTVDLLCLRLVSFVPVVSGGIVFQGLSVCACVSAYMGDCPAGVFC